MKRSYDSASLVRLATGVDECDIALSNVRVVDVFNCKVTEPSTVWIGAGRVVAVTGPGETKLKAREMRDLEGRYLLPGLMDAHVHIESTQLTPGNFAKGVLPFGTTGVIADPHEIANVCGAEGLRYMLDAAAGLPVKIRFSLPSCVPCTPFEDAGAVLTAQDLAPFMKDPGVIALGEVMNVPGVLFCDGDMIAKIEAALDAGITIDGHAPGIGRDSLQAYAAAGPRNDHECVDAEEARMHVENGMYVFIREGSAARQLADLLPAVTAHNMRRFCFCTDDLHAADLLEEGHINRILRRAVALGLDPTMAVAMASLNVCESYGIDRCGAIAPGYVADMCLVDDLVDFQVRAVWTDGRLVAEDGHAVVDIPVVQPSENILHSMHIGSFSEESLRLTIPSGRARVIGLAKSFSLVTESLEEDVVCKDGVYATDGNPGLCKLVVCERHKGLGLVGLGLIRGYVQPGTHLNGAVATSIAHDSHNVICCGDSDGDIAAAVRKVAELGGGIAIYKDGCLLASQALPVAGLMGLGDRFETAEAGAEIAEAAGKLPLCEGLDPVMTLAFMSLCVIPELKLSTRGLFDVAKFDFVPVDAAAKSASR